MAALTLIELTARTNHRRIEMGQPPLSPELIETLEPDVRRALSESIGGSHFTKAYTLALVAGVVSLAAFTDMLYHTVARVVHADGTEVSMLLYPNASASDLLRERNMMFYWGVIDAADTLTVYDGSGVAAPDGNLTAEFGFVQTLAAWPTQFVPQLVEACAGIGQGAVAA